MGADNMKVSEGDRAVYVVGINHTLEHHETRLIKQLFYTYGVSESYQ